MKTNQILRSLINTLTLSSKEVLEIYQLAALPLSEERLQSLLCTDEEKEDFILCSFEELGAFLDGLVLFKRGPSPSPRQETDVIALTNNLILKKLRIALELKEPETEIVFALGEAELSRQELKSLFRKEGHKNFRACSDALLMAFLEGLDEYYYDGGEV